MNKINKIVQRLIERHDLVVPFDLDELVSHYADIHYKHFPFSNIDGIVLNPKKIKSRTTDVLINCNISHSRQRFTLAHELGHIIIPWHTGSIIENIDIVDMNSYTENYIFEDEANQFAASLLIPEQFLEQFDLTLGLAEVHKQVAKSCDVSLLASALRIVDFFKGSYIFISEKNGIVEFAGKSKTTFAPIPIWGNAFNLNAYNGTSIIHNQCKLSSRTIHWWEFPSELPVDTQNRDMRSWRKILDDILNENSNPGYDIQRYKRSLNGVISSAHGRLCKDTGYSAKNIVAACFQRLNNDEKHSELVNHPDFNLFLSKRAEDFLSK